MTIPKSSETSLLNPNVVRIYKASNRHVLVNAQYIRLASFSYKQSNIFGTNGFGSISFLNEYRLAPNGELLLENEPATCLLILPLAGYLTCQSGDRVIKDVGCEQIALCNLEAVNSWKIHNLDAKEEARVVVVGFDAVCLKSNKFLEVAPILLEALNEPATLHLNVLVREFLRGQVGVYEGRKDAQYLALRKDSGILFFVIQGAFEVEGRLVETGDALSFTDHETIRFEALTANAVLLVLEAPFNQESLTHSIR
jgi:hypothetical protein